MANLIDFDFSKEGQIGYLVEGFAPLILERNKLNQDMQEQIFRLGAKTGVRNPTAQVCSQIRAEYCAKNKLDPKKLTEAQEDAVLKMQRPAAHAAMQSRIQNLYNGVWIGPREGGGFRDLSVASEYDLEILARAISTVHKMPFEKVHPKVLEMDKPQKEGGNRGKLREYALGGKVPDTYRDLAKKAGIEVSGGLDAQEDFLS